MDDNKHFIQSQTFVHLLLVLIFLKLTLKLYHNHQLHLLNYFDFKPNMARIDLKAMVFTNVYEIQFCVEEDKQY